MFNCFKKRENMFNNKIIPENYNFNLNNFNPLLLKNGKISTTLIICIDNNKFICKKYIKTYTKEYRNEINILKNIYDMQYFPYFFKNLVDVNYRYILYRYFDGFELFNFHEFNQFKINDDITLKIILEQIIDALSCLLTLNVIHLNLTPNNIIVSNYKPISIKIIDLKYCENIVNKKNKPHRCYGYASPEVVFQKNYYHNSDIWSVGCIIYYIITKKHLFQQTPKKYFYELINFTQFNKYTIERDNISIFWFNIIHQCLTPLHFLRPQLKDIKKILKKNKLQIT